MEGSNPITEKALRMLSDERYRVINKKGITHEADQEYTDFQLIRASSAYMMLPIFVEANYSGAHDKDGNRVPLIWPWPSTWFRADSLDRKHELIKGLQLGLAELERLLFLEDQKRDIPMGKREQDNDIGNH